DPLAESRIGGKGGTGCTTAYEESLSLATSVRYNRRIIPGRRSSSPPSRRSSPWPSDPPPPDGETSLQTERDRAHRRSAYLHDSVERVPRLLELFSHLLPPGPFGLIPH